VLLAAVSDPGEAAREIQMPFGAMPLGGAVDMIVCGDLFIHTWDVARATGGDERLDPGEVSRMLASIGSFPEDVLRADGMYGPRVEVPDDAGEQAKLLAYTGRRP
jgi:uncharacterized protein (TIGR03086 family)